ncbi:GtrA family protein [Hyphomicrobium sp. CS1GBMeth3]|uniref:GtrA family protein n=1 Tax=Hyphomicrobium sp. CS1GBMeth3 TaxID=1892845 RepID=UPI0009FA91B0|nr:GtrA family protein [Hyphomicrobium sp. CS1GBMeth3]
MTRHPDSPDLSIAPEAQPQPRQPHTRAERILRLVRYTGVNLVSLVIDYGVFLGLLNFTGLPVLASVAGYAVAFSVNYKLSRWLVFVGDGAHKSDRRLFTEFMATGLLGIALTAMVTAAGIHLLGIAPTIAKGAAMLICFVTLYFIRSRFVFTRLD